MDEDLTPARILRVRYLRGNGFSATAALLKVRTAIPRLSAAGLATGALIGRELLQLEVHTASADHYRPSRWSGHVYVINSKTSTGSWEPLFIAEGKALYPLPMAELDAIKELRPTGGLTLRRDGSSLPWFGKGEYLERLKRSVSQFQFYFPSLHQSLNSTDFSRWTFYWTAPWP